ncbi:MAG: cupin-like domain-containing protein [Xanthomonadales bacterium]|nr:cupin-like domain-containing protein [Xanthomonadales bacterium]
MPDEILRSTQPLLLKGLVGDWPMVQAAEKSARDADLYLRQFNQDETVGAFFGEPNAQGRVYYNEDLSGFNYQPVIVKLDEVLDKLQQHLADQQAPAFYVGSTPVDKCLPGFRDENDIEFDDFDPLVSIWIGNRTRIAAHFDVPDNVACCAAGRRRFILFPPSEIRNLYVGPLDFNPGGQSISMVDFNQPDYETFPRFRDALQNAQVAEMEPGDAIFIPSMWWHHVEALDGFNVLINYWWRQSPSFMDSPANVLEHALLSLRDLPAEQRRAWHEVFKFYIFDYNEGAIEHIPEKRRGVLAPIDDSIARRLRAKLLKRLNR